jgi:hypothetical protein
MTPQKLKSALILAVTLLVGALPAAVPAGADGKKDCTTAPRANWKPQADAEIAAKAAGYEVRRSKVEGACYEVYAVKDGKRYELFFDPVDLKLMQSVVK